MRQLLYVFALLMVIGWFFGVFALALGGFIHMLIIFALIAAFLGAIRGENMS